MQSFKLLATALCALLLASPVAFAQKKADKNHPPTVALEATQTTPYSAVRRDSLLNGFQVITLERPTDPTVKCDIIIRTGAMFDLTGKTGLAALTQATLLAPNPRLKEELESLQAKIDWGINWDTTWFHIETPLANFDTVFEIIARLLVVENVRPEAFQAAQQQQIDRIKGQTVTSAERADAAFLKAIYGEHPYGHNLHGTGATIAGIKAGDVYDFIKRFYIANNASITLVGPVTSARAMRSFKVFFGGWIKGQLTPATFRQPAQVAQLRLIKTEANDAANVELRGGLIGVKRTDPDFLATEAIAQIVAMRLKNAAEGAGGSATAIAAPRALSGPIFFAASVPAESAPEVSRRATESFAALASAAVAESEFAAAKAALADSYQAQPVEFYLREIEAFGLPKDYGVTIQKKIAALTAADVQRVAKRLFDANALTVVVLGKVTGGFKTNP